MPSVFGFEGSHYLILDVCNQSPYRVQRFNTKHRGHSIDNDFQEGTGQVCVLFIHIKVADSWEKNTCIP
jgi:hypothetical protein